jgi:deoxyribodipyrimidine photo-lyase
LLAAADAAPNTVALFVLDPRLLGPSGPARTAFLAGCLRELNRALDGRLLVRRGDPATVVPDTARRVGATTVHVSADAGPYGRQRDRRVAEALPAVGAELVATGSPYAVTPGRVRKADGTPYRVFTPFYRAWTAHGWRAPADSGATSTRWLPVPDDLKSVPAPELGPEMGAGSGTERGAGLGTERGAGLDTELGAGLGAGLGTGLPAGLAGALPVPGEAAALAAWARFRDGALGDYPERRDQPGLAGTSRLSAYLKFGCLHPRTLLAELTAHDQVFRAELGWREFYADVLRHRPDTARRNADRRYDAMPVDQGAQADRLFAAWCDGRTGYPVVDAGMRQLRTEKWMHNRVRMIVASFLVKDLHLPWWRGARHFMRELVDGDLASNQHGWQWAAGSGTDAAPYFRVFNPVSQGEKFDPHGDYVRRYLPELRGVAGRAVHRPWKLPGGPPNGYPAPIVDHAVERAEALARYELVKAAR